MTTNPEGLPAAVQDAGTDAAGNPIDKIRDLLFGGQMRDYDRQFARLEERLLQETADVRADVKRRLTALEEYLRAELDSLSERLRAEQDVRAAGSQELGRDLRAVAQQFEQRTVQLDEQLARNGRELRQTLHTQRQELADEIRQRVDEVLARLAREAHELRADKTDRRALASMLTELAVRLNGDEGEVRG
jgi:hypothetical protein